MNLAEVIFYFFCATAALSALALLFTRNVFYGALLLIACLLSIAGLFVLAYAEFIAITQILIYAGGVLVVIIFGIMLTSKLGDKPLRVAHGHWFSGFLVGVSFFALVVYLISQETFAEAGSGDGNMKQGDEMINRIGAELMTSYVVPFEVAGILLLIALIGAAVTASGSTNHNNSSV